MGLLLLFDRRTTKVVRATIKKSDGSLVANEAVRYAILEYDSGSSANADWMSRANTGTIATDGSGILTAPYSGPASIGSTVYLMVIRTDDSLLWTETVEAV